MLYPFILRLVASTLSVLFGSEVFTDTLLIAQLLPAVAQQNTAFCFHRNVFPNQLVNLDVARAGASDGKLKFFVMFKSAAALLNKVTVIGDAYGQFRLEDSG